MLTYQYFVGVILTIMLIALIPINLILAQQTSDQEWKTYYQPQSYSIDYPIFPGKSANITKASDTPIEVTMITSQPVIITIVITHWGSFIQYVDPQEQAVIQKQNLLENDTNVTITQDLFTSVYDDKLGYTYVAFNPDLQSTESYTFIESGNNMYEFQILGMAYNPKTVDNINKILESIKFFD